MEPAHCKSQAIVPGRAVLVPAIGRVRLESAAPPAELLSPSSGYSEIGPISFLASPRKSSRLSTNCCAQISAVIAF